MRKLRLSGLQPWPPSQHCLCDPEPRATSPISCLALRGRRRSPRAYSGSHLGRKPPSPEGSWRRAPGSAEGSGHTGWGTPGGDTGACQPVLLACPPDFTLSPEPMESGQETAGHKPPPWALLTAAGSLRGRGSGAHPRTSSGQEAEPGPVSPSVTQAVPGAVGRSTVRTAEAQDSGLTAQTETQMN